ncbi:carbohydrate-binding module family 43 protein/Glycoside hydrolase family 72 protein [Clavulina sp. PMI_390]|nr:carbohydrate-binding module family 43 protein/Glycoside hydrolase family 72 protein [Clavulina sp. PMI_390]
MRLSSALLAAGLVLADSATAVQKISRAGRYLFGADGNRFYIKGLSYQQQGLITSSDPTAFPEPSDYIDPLADSAGCARDLPYMKQLGINTIRVYSVNSSANHDSCMSALSGAGIYTIIDLSLPVNGSINRASPQWGTNLLNLYIETIEAFSKYDNVLAYNVGNEVSNDINSTVAAPFVKAAARDVKAYLKSQNLPQLVGYAAVDAPDTWRFPLAEYLSCGSDAQSIDIYGLNNYEWCGASSFQSAYTGTENAFTNYNIPAYFSEFGCVSSPPRLWTEVQSLFGTDMTSEWSGGIAFSYFPAYGGFGMVNISSDAKSVTTSDDFTRLVTQYSNVSFIESPSETSAGTTSFPSCAAATSNFLASNSLPPTPNANTCNCVAQSFSCLFTPQTPNYTDIIGELLDYGCSQLGADGSNCDLISSNGQTGTYGALSGCDPTIQLSYVMSSLYEATNRDPVTCNFSGNATQNPSAPPTKASAEAAAQSCLNASPASTFTPSSVPIPGTSSATNSGSTGSGTPTSTHNSGAGTWRRLGLGFTHGGSGWEGVVALMMVTVGAMGSGIWLVL